MNPFYETTVFENCVGQDCIYLEVFCQKYGAKVVGIFPNTETVPPRGLIYVFDNQPGGFSIQGIKNSLEESLEEKISEER